MAELADRRPHGGRAPDAALCHDQLRRILDSPAFDATDRDRRFLSYVVEESLAGRADRIKAYTVALEVFVRDASFDPQTDPIVRVEAGHLRRALDRYYLSAGRGDPLVIAIPKGSYAPTFTPRAVAVEAFDAPPPARFRRPLALAALAFLLVGGIGYGAARLAGGSTASSGALPLVPRLAVEPFEALGGGDADLAIAAALGAEVVTEVARFKDIVIIARADSSAGAPPPAYRLSGSVTTEGDLLRVHARLERRSDGAVLWADNYHADLSQEKPFAAEARIAGEVATAVGQPYGAVFQAAAADHSGRPRSEGAPYACTIAYFAYRATLDPPGYARARECLEKAVASFPDYASAWALLAQVHIDGRRWGFAPDRSLEDTLEEARRALMLDPLNVRGLQAKMLALHLAGDIDGALRTGAAAFAINPNDTELTGEYGYRLALAGRWEEGCALLQRALDRNPGPLPYYETGLALCAYIGGDYADAAARIRAIPIPAVPIYHLMAAAFLAEAGDLDAARHEREWLEAYAPDLVPTLLAQVTPLVGRPEDLERFMRSLQRAGLDAPSGDQRQTP